MEWRIWGSSCFLVSLQFILLILASPSLFIPLQGYLVLSTPELLGFYHINQIGFQLLPLHILNLPFSGLLPFPSSQFSKFWCCHALLHFLVPLGFISLKQNPLSFVLVVSCKSTKEKSMCVQCSLFGKVIYFLYVQCSSYSNRSYFVLREMAHSFTQDYLLLPVVWNLFTFFLSLFWTYLCIFSLLVKCHEET